ncbi:RagB/SusD family nutrient uptake outer membrane protein [Flavobacterium sp. J27]|uniref:RagB/SusD family nutrient uptake outer membrane protein n=1 Tax=Flavobacterium sp. J27 TaxID=2060419 RepID=UPI001030D582|nr:RagB/SusD family nutrient uptake outer membrane protein [Flavobacterium sp. J27]
MKRISLLLSISVVGLLSSCSDSYTDKDLRSDVSQQQLQGLAASSPEALLTIASGLEAGNNFFLNDFNTAGNGNIHDDFGLKSIQFGLDEMSNDVVQVANHWFGNYYRYTGRQETNRVTDMVWKFYYKVIFNMNSTLKLIPSDASTSELRYLRARCKAIRGFAYFDLIRIYGNGETGIPMYDENTSRTERVPTSEIKALIISDLMSAYDELDGYSRPSIVQLNKNVVAGMLSRYYLEYASNSSEYQLAAQYAAEARTGYTLDPNNINFNDANWDGMCNINNPEWLWGADLNTNTSTYYASFFSNVGSLNPGYAGLLQIFKSGDKRLVESISATDKRKDWFASAGNGFGIPQYANLKFYDFTDFEGDYVFMRAAEMYLNEAEALALGGDDAGARQALYNLVSTRDAAYTLSSNSGQNLLDEIRTHRRIELWGEGFAFYDMKRWNQGLLRNYSGTNHATFGLLDYPAGSVKFIFQIPILEMNNNIDIAQNNPF